MKVAGKADFAKKLKTYLHNNFESLRPQTHGLSRDTSCASFEVPPRFSCVHNVYVECRWAPWSKDPALNHLEEDVVRLVVQLKQDRAEQAESIASVLADSAPKDFDVRLSAVTGPIYVTKSGLPHLDVTVLPSGQKETSLKYGEECVRVEAFWRESLDRIRARLGIE